MSFWDRTWKSFDWKRAFSYLDHFDVASDPIVRFLLARGVRSVCDAGCGCGVYSLNLAMHGFSVSGFDISEDAVSLTVNLLSDRGYPVHGFHTASILSTGYPDEAFDAVVARDVLDHLPIRIGKASVSELFRITRPDGCVLLTLDRTDAEYESEPHVGNADDDYIYTDGKWKGMVFHPYSLEEIGKLTSGYRVRLLSSTESGFLLVLEK